MFSWAKNFKSSRSDGRHISSLAAIMAEIRADKPLLSYKPGMSRSEYFAWQTKVKEQLFELMQFPRFTPQPQPQCLSRASRTGYRLEKWEFYPDSYTAVPLLMLIPDAASPKSPLPAVLCFPGSASSKELLAGEPSLAHPNCSSPNRFPQRNAQALHIVRAGMIAVAFDNPGTAELAEFEPPDQETQWGTRTAFVNGLLNYGYNYLGWSVFQKLRFMEWFRTLTFVDQSRLGCCGHSLGSEVEMILGLLCDDFKVMIHNDFVCDSAVRYVSLCNVESEKLNDGGNWHHVPGFWRFFGFSDLLAAAAPKFLSVNEGGADEFIDKIRHAYEVLGVSQRFQVHYYPRFAAKENRSNQNRAIPRQDLSMEEFYEDYSYVDIPDHSFRPEPSLKWLKKAFEMC